MFPTPLLVLHIPNTHAGMHITKAEQYDDRNKLSLFRWNKEFHGFIPKDYIEYVFDNDQEIKVLTEKQLRDILVQPNLQKVTLLIKKSEEKGGGREKGRP